MGTGTHVRADGKRAPSMLDVAHAAGVSAQTVSRALSDHPNVQPATRAKVLAAVEKLGYRRNSAARALSSGRSRTIGILTLRNSSYSRAAMTVGAEAAAADAGYTVAQATTPSLDAAAIEDAISRLAAQAVEGIILAVPLIRPSDAIRQLTREIPTVTVDGSRTDDAEAVSVDQAGIGRLATTHLLELGHATVWHVAGPQEWSDARARLEGWRAALADAGADAAPELSGDWSPESGYRAGRILARIPDATAVFAACDDMAFGVIRALTEAGRRVPEDVSVVGVDDVPLAGFCTPPLTTVIQPFGDIGRIACEHLLSRVVTPAPAADTAIEPRLVVRQSTSEHCYR